MKMPTRKNSSNLISLFIKKLLKVKKNRMAMIFGQFKIQMRFVRNIVSMLGWIFFLQYPCSSVFNSISELLLLDQAHFFAQN
jgi:hypothetical protein